MKWYALLWMAINVFIWFLGVVSGRSMERVAVAKRILRWQKAGKDFTALAVWEEPTDDAECIVEAAECEPEVK